MCRHILQQRNRMTLVKNICNPGGQAEMQPWWQGRSGCSSTAQHRDTGCKGSASSPAGTAQGRGNPCPWRCPKPWTGMWHLGTRGSVGLGSAGGMVGLYPRTIKAGKAPCDSAFPVVWVFFVSSDKDLCCKVT